MTIVETREQSVEFLLLFMVLIRAIIVAHVIGKPGF